MNKSIPYNLNCNNENKILFYNIYLPEFFNLYKNYLSELNLCIEYNYIKSQKLENKIDKLINFYNNINTPPYTIPKYTFKNNKVLESGEKKLSVEFIIYWINEFNKLSNKIQNEIIKKCNTQEKNLFQNISDSIGHLTFLFNIFDNNTSPYYDVTNNLTMLNCPVGASIYNKINKNNKTLLSFAELKTNTILKNNLKNLQSSNVSSIELGGKGVYYTTISHGENLITDLKAANMMFTIIAKLNSILSQILDFIWEIVNYYKSKNDNLTNDDKAINTIFENKDVEGKNIYSDLFKNIYK